VVLNFRQHFQRLSETDPLTGLGNRMSFNHALETFSKQQGDRSLLMLGIDDFKSINDTYGHAVGDRIIRHLAGVMLAALRENDPAPSRR